MRGLYCLISFSVLLRSSNAFTSFSGLSTTSFTQTKNDESSSRVVFYRKSDDYLENLDKMQMSEEGRRAAERAAREAQSDEEAIRLIMLMKAREKVMSGEIDELTPDTKFIFGDEDSDLDAFEYYVSDSDRYAAIENWSDRAYQILLDLGLVEESDI